MKYMKILGLAAMALAALMAMAGTASATILTSPSGTTYTSTIKAEALGTVTLTSVFGGFGAIECNKSIVEGKVEEHGSASTAGGKISSISFAECKNGEPTTAGQPNAGSLQVHSTGTTGNGTLTSFNASITVHKTAFGTCTFSTSSTGTHIGTLTGSSITKGNAVLDIENAKLSSPCGTGTWEGKYKVVSPSFLDVH